MKSVGIKQLKNELSRYLKMVQAGETVLVTDRDEVVAEIHKPTTPSPSVGLWDAFLNQQERAGTLLRAKRKDSVATTKPMGSGLDWQQILASIREDRF